MIKSILILCSLLILSNAFASDINAFFDSVNDRDPVFDNQHTLNVKGINIAANFDGLCVAQKIHDYRCNQKRDTCAVQCGRTGGAGCYDKCNEVRDECHERARKACGVK